MPLFDRLVRLKVAVPLLVLALAATTVAYVVIGTEALLVMLALGQIGFGGFAMLAAREHARSRGRFRAALRSVDSRVERQAATLRSAADVLDGVSRRLAGVESSVTAGRETADRIRRQLDGITESAAAEHARQTEWRGAVERRFDEVRTDLKSLTETMSARVDTASRNQYHQVEALINLYRELGFEGALPPLAGWAASPDLLWYLFRLVRDEGREHVLECGSGVSTVVMAYAMRDAGRGRVVALDHLPQYAESTRAMLDEHGLGEWAEVRHAPLGDVKLDDRLWSWYDTEALPPGPFDLLVVDGPPAGVGEQARFPAVPVLIDRLAESSIVVLDDHNRPDEKSVGLEWRKVLPEWTAKHLSHDKGTLELRSPA